MVPGPALAVALSGLAGPAAAVLSHVAALGAAADHEGVGLQGHAAEELLAGALDPELGDLVRARVELGVAHEAGELVGVGRADVDVRQGVGAVEEFAWEAEVWDGLPDDWTEG